MACDIARNNQVIEEDQFHSASDLPAEGATEPTGPVLVPLFSSVNKQTKALFQNLCVKECLMLRDINVNVSGKMKSMSERYQHDTAEANSANVSRDMRESCSRILADYHPSDTRTEHPAARTEHPEFLLMISAGSDTLLATLAARLQWWQA